VVAAGLAWVAARRIGPAGTQRHRLALFVSFVVLFTLGGSTLLPLARGWKQERDVDALLESEPVFSVVIADEPALRDPLRANLLMALRNGTPAEALLDGRRRVSPQLWRYVPQGSDAAALALGKALVATLTRLQAEDPQECYRYLFPTVAGPPRDGASPAAGDILAALRDVVVSARNGSAEPLDRRAAAKRLDAAYGRLRERYGDDVDALKNAQAPGADRARVCAMTIALYSELVALPAPAAGQTLRHTLGPADKPVADGAPVTSP
jgi:hypothetical protein